MMEQDRERLCGPKHVPNSARRAVRGGSTRGEVTLGGRRILVPRLRARSVDGHELELPSFVYAAGRDPLDARTLEAIAIGITTRKYHRALDPLPTGTRKRAVSKSSVSRRFVALTSAQLTTWLARPLGDLEVRSVFLDGLHFRDHVILLRAGRGFPGPEARPRPARGDDRERDRLQGPAGRPARPGGSTASAQCSSSSTAGPASARHCARRVAPTAVVQRCQVHKRRTVLAHLPEAMRPRVCRALAEAYELADVTLANRRLLQLAAGLDHTHPGAAASLREGLDETLTRPRLGVTGALYRTLRIPTASRISTASSDTSSALCAAGATAARSSAGSLPACRRSLAASAGCVVTVTLLPLFAPSTARPWTAGRRSHRSPEPPLTRIQQRAGHPPNRRPTRKHYAACAALARHAHGLAHSGGDTDGLEGVMTCDRARRRISIVRTSSTRHVLRWPAFTGRARADSQRARIRRSHLRNRTC